MLARSSSSRRRRASRCVASPSDSPLHLAVGDPPSRRASIAATPDSESARPGKQQVPELLRTSPRNSLVPGSDRGPRHSISTDDARQFLTPGHNRSPRNSLTPDVGRSPRHSLLPEPGNLLDPEALLRSSHHSLAPDITRSSRNLAPDSGTRSHRNSLVPDPNRSHRNSLVPEYDRSPRNSLVPDYSERRKSTTPEYDRSPRGSLVPGYDRSPRNSLVPDYDRSPRNSIIPDTMNRSPRNSITPDPMSRSPRNSLGSEHMTRISPRNSIVPDHDRSPRHSLVPESNRSPRASLVPGEFNRSPRNSVVPDSTYLRSPRTSIHDARVGDLAVAGTSGLTRPTSPYRLSVTARGAQINMGYLNGVDPASRRASSNVSQVSADDRRRLCERSKLSGAVGVLRLTAYGSVVYQLKDANQEASGSIDFVIRALRVVYKTVVVTVILVCLTSLPLLMLIMGIQYVRDCPVEPHLPVYMLVGGCTAIVRMSWMLYSQIKSRRYERLDLAVPVANLEDGFLTPSAGSRVAAIALNSFLIVWFILGNYWISHIYWPEFHPTLFEPDRWCSKTLYIFALVHLCVVYGILSLMVLLILVLMFCQLLSCPVFTRYK